MYITKVAQDLINYYNKQEGTQHSPESFFYQVFYQIVLDGNKTLNFVHNSVFNQVSKVFSSKRTSKEGREELKQMFETKVNTGNRSATVVVSYPPSDEKGYNQYSGLTPSIELDEDIEMVYLSWIGDALSCAVYGNCCFLFNDPELNYKIIKGWQYYRDLLNDELVGDVIKGGKLKRWNSFYLAYTTNRNFKGDFSYSTLDQFGCFKMDKKKIDLESPKWSEVYFAVSNLLGERELIAYMYNTLISNKTPVCYRGFVVIKLEQHRNLLTTYKNFFGEEQYLLALKDFAKILGTNINHIAESGSIGYNQLEPKHLLWSKELTDNQFKIYKTYLFMILAKEKPDILEYTQSVADLISAFEKSEKKSTKKIIDRIVKAKSKNAFLNVISEIVEKTKEESVLKSLKELVAYTHKVPSTDFFYFLTLLNINIKFNSKNN